MSEYDYIVVGAGSAGCLLAARLAERGHEVLLLEAGPTDRTRFCEVPGMVSVIHTVPQVKKRFDWGYYTVPQKNALDRRIPAVRGKVLGGSSSINGMLFVRGHRQNYDDWAADGCPGWSYQDVLPAFKRMEDWEEGESASRGAGGPIAVTRQKGLTPASQAFIEAVKDTFNVPYCEDYNGHEQEGAMIFQQSARKGRRFSSSIATLRSNAARLTVRTGVMVERVLLKGSTATGVAIRVGAERQTVSAHEQFYYNVPWPADTVATAYATIPDNASVLHHWLLFATNELQPEGAHITAPLPTLIGTDPQLLTGWAVGGPNLEMPDDVGMELPNPGRTINVQWHFYNSSDTLQKDKSSVQICTVPKSTRPNTGSVTFAGTEDLNGNVWSGGPGMPAGKESTFTTTCRPGRGDIPIHIVGFEPHMHRTGKRMTSTIIRKDGTKDAVFDKPFVFGNETHYFSPHDIMPGEMLETSCSFFNDNNFGVPFGESTDTEMCYQFVFHYPAHAMTNGAFSLLGVSDTCWYP